MAIDRALYSVREFPGATELNPLLSETFARLNLDDSLSRSHFFRRRYENIYLPLMQIPDLVSILDFAEQSARDILGTPGARLHTGFWFNLMQPTESTTRHSHDDDDELLSAVYYLRVPPDSGELILHPVSGAERIVPKEGRLILFSPDLPHEVSENRSDEARLSIGMNIGPAF